MTRQASNKAVGYFRRSSKDQESSLKQQFTWFKKTAHEQRLTTDATEDDLAYMLEKRLSYHKDIYLDDGISGSRTDRPGFTKLNQRIEDDNSVSHVLIYDRDRTSRPLELVEAIFSERKLIRHGITIVYRDKTIDVNSQAESELVELLLSAIDFNSSSEFSKKLSARIIVNKISKALQGHWTGGTAPYGFDRVYVDAAGNRYVLRPGEKRKDPGGHVELQPNQEEIQIVQQVFLMRAKGAGFQEIADILDRQCVPYPGTRGNSPDKWKANAIKRICNNSLFIGKMVYGVRSEGIHNRLDAGGTHRPTRQDERNEYGKPVVQINPKETMIITDAPFDPIIEMDLWDKVQAFNEQRAQSQKGISRSRKQAEYLLACMIHDIADDGSTHLMYGHRKEKRLKYTCSKYMTSKGTECHHNQLNAVEIEQMTTRFTFNMVMKLEEMQLKEVIQNRLRDRIQGHNEDLFTIASRLEAAIANYDQEISNIDELMIRKNEEDFVESMLKKRKEREDLKWETQEQLKKLNSQKEVLDQDSERLTEIIMNGAQNPGRFLNSPEQRKRLQQLFQELEIRIGARFHEERKGSRKVRKPEWLVLSIGNDYAMKDLIQQYLPRKSA